MIDIDTIEYILGIQIYRNPNSGDIHLRQEKYIETS